MTGGRFGGAITREIESFLLELGAGFTFVARQKRLQIDDEDFHLDLLFYNRRLRRLVAVEVKVGEFKASHRCQMEHYLRGLDKHEREPGEASPFKPIPRCEGGRWGGDGRGATTRAPTRHSRGADGQGRS
ncbi:PDDEXK nuclease domain-containing protein [Pseudomonas gingeri]|uniref:PDDEXK nuclease domain-containing protein n=1 Tax=Pseudomonas gingeri TaxID=117681 RepID=UPI003FA1A781